MKTPNEIANPFYSLTPLWSLYPHKVVETSEQFNAKWADSFTDADYKEYDNV